MLLPSPRFRLTFVVFFVALAVPGLGASAAAAATCTKVGTAGADVLIGTAGRDVLCGLGGNDRLVGGGGNDLLLGGAGNDALFGAGGADRLVGGDGADRLAGGIGGDTLSGGNGVDVLRGDAGPNSLSSGAGNDVLQGGAGSDAMNGGTGLDTVTFADATAGIDVSLASARASGFGADTLGGLENIVGSKYADELTGSGGPNTVAGGSGSDELSGLGGNDRLDANAGNDTVSGGNGNDVLKGGTGNDALDGGAGTNPCYGGGGSDRYRNCGDVTKPKVVSFDLATRSVDSSTGPVQMSATVRTTDDISGVKYFSARFSSPGGKQFVDFVWQDATHPLTDTRVLTAQLPRYAAQGEWELSWLLVLDNVGNTLSVQLPGSRALPGVDATFMQNGTGDVTAPAVGSIQLDRTTVDTSTGAQSLEATVQVSDALSGVNYLMARYTSPSGQFIDFSAADPRNPTIGTPNNAKYVLEATMPNSAEQGTWKLTWLLVADAVGNQRSLDYAAVSPNPQIDAEFQQAGAGDHTSPQLVSLGLDATAFNVLLGSQQVTGTIDIADSGSGVQYISARYTGPGGQQFLDLLPTQQAPTTGTTNNGSWDIGGTLPQHSETGTWKLSWLLLRDATGNMLSLDYAQVAALAGVDSTFVVSNDP